MSPKGIIVHGRGKIKASFEQVMKNYSIPPTMKLMYTEREGQTAELARQLADSGYSHILAVGGDGTISDVIHGIKSSGNSTCIAGFWPMGTANDWSKTWKIPAHFSDILASMASGNFIESDLGIITYPQDKDRYFINIADIGIGAEVVQRVNGSTKFLGGNLTFLLSIMKTLLTYKNIEVRCESSDWHWTGKAKSVVVANGKYFGSGIAIAPEASPIDGWLNLVIIGDVNLLDYLRYLPALKKGKKVNDPRVIYRTIKSVNLITSPGCGVEADGELLGETPVKISIVPKGIRLLPPL